MTEAAFAESRQDLHAPATEVLSDAPLPVAELRSQRQRLDAARADIERCLEGANAALRRLAAELGDCKSAFQDDQCGQAAPPDGVLQELACLQVGQSEKPADRRSYELQEHACRQMGPSERSAERRSFGSLSLDEALRPEPKKRSAPSLVPGRSATVNTDIGQDVRALEAVQGWHKPMIHQNAEVPGEMSKINSVFMYVPGRSRQRRLESVERWSAVLVLVNMLFMMVEVEIDMRSTLSRERSPLWIWVVNVMFTVTFAVELLMRVELERRAFIFGPCFRWNMFDTLVVLAQIVDLVLTYASISFVRVFRIFRVIRAAKMIKTASNVRELRLMLAALMASFPSLSWAIILIVLVMTVYSMFVMQIVRGYIDEVGLDRVAPDVIEMYGSLPSSVLTLFMSVSGGLDWGDAARPLERMGTFYVVTFVFFMAFVLLGMLNILTAVFVESTNKLSLIDAEVVIQETIDAEESAFNRLRQIMMRADSDHSGTLTQEELDSRLQDPRVVTHLKILDLHVHEARALFRLLDAEGTGEVDISEMLHGMMRLKGTARSLDMATMLYESKRLLTVIGRLNSDMDRRFSDLRNFINLSSARRTVPCDPPAGGTEGALSARGDPSSTTFNSRDTPGKSLANL